MPDHCAKLAFVVATKDRPDDLRTMLQSLVAQTRRPDQVVIVDSSAEPVVAVANDFPGLGVKYIRHEGPPSASRQRNVGIRAVGSDMDFIGFLDDDVVLEADAIERVMEFMEAAPDDLGGCSMNLLNFPRTSGAWLKASAPVRWLGLYSSRKGAVMPSGWQTLTGTVAETTFVEWLPTTAAVWRRRVFDDFRFDEFFDGYSYLEDLDFSYAVSKRYRLAIVADAKFHHYPSPSGRISPYRSGRIEVRNRRYIVRKHGLSGLRCHLGVAIRLLMTLTAGVATRKSAHFQRAIGNCAGLFAPLCLNGQCVHTEQ